MDFDKYLNMPNCDDELILQPTITKTSFEDKNNILTDTNLQKEMGFVKMDNGDYLVAMICPMPNVTKEMIDWWFWWHTQESIRYQLWYPTEHISISYAEKDKDYFTADKFTGFQPNTQYPVEKIGKLKATFEIQFEYPTTFGFSEELIHKNNVATIVCGHVGAFGLKHSEMAHIFFHNEEGLFLVSRFWIGKLLKNPLVRKIVLNDKTAQDMARHCFVEYRNLAKKLPNIYREVNK